jgi:hypothetical protein
MSSSTLLPSSSFTTPQRRGRRGGRQTNASSNNNNKSSSVPAKKRKRRGRGRNRRGNQTPGNQTPSKGSPLQAVTTPVKQASPAQTRSSNKSKQKKAARARLINKFNSNAPWIVTSKMFEESKNNSFQNAFDIKNKQDFADIDNKIQNIEQGLNTVDLKVKQVLSNPKSFDTKKAFMKFFQSSAAFAELIDIQKEIQREKNKNDEIFEAYKYIIKNSDEIYDAYEDVLLDAKHSAANQREVYKQYMNSAIEFVQQQSDKIFEIYKEIFAKVQLLNNVNNNFDALKKDYYNNEGQLSKAVSHAYETGKTTLPKARSLLDTATDRILIERLYEHVDYRGRSWQKLSENEKRDYAKLIMSEAIKENLTLKEYFNKKTRNKYMNFDKLPSTQQGAYFDDTKPHLSVFERPDFKRTYKFDRIQQFLRRPDVEDQEFKEYVNFSYVPEGSGVHDKQTASGKNILHNQNIEEKKIRFSENLFKYGNEPYYTPVGTNNDQHQKEFRSRPVKKPRTSFDQPLQSFYGHPGKIGSFTESAFHHYPNVQQPSTFPNQSQYNIDHAEKEKVISYPVFQKPQSNNKAHFANFIRRAFKR